MTILYPSRGNLITSLFDLFYHPCFNIFVIPSISRYLDEFEATHIDVSLARRTVNLVLGQHFLVFPFHVIDILHPSIVLGVGSFLHFAGLA